MAQFGRTDWRQRYEDFRNRQGQIRGDLASGALTRDPTPQRDERYNIGTSPPPGAMQVSDSIWRGQDGFYYRRDPGTGNFYAAVSTDGTGEYAIDRQNWEAMYPTGGNGAPPNWQAPTPGVSTPVTPIAPPTQGGGGLPVTGTPGGGGGGGLPPSGDSGGTGRPPITTPPVLRPPVDRPTTGAPGQGPDRGAVQSGLLASFGFAPGPAGGLLPVMLQQGGNPFQQGPPRQDPTQRGYVAPTQLAQAVFAPDLQGYQWWQPPPPAEPEPPGTAPPTAPPSGGGYYGPPNYNGGYDPNTGTYYELPKAGQGAGDDVGVDSSWLDFYRNQIGSDPRINPATGQFWPSQGAVDPTMGGRIPASGAMPQGLLGGVMPVPPALRGLLS